MGFSFRKSIKIGPARVNLSKSGVGFSVGAGGLRYTKSPKRKSSKSTVAKRSTNRRTATSQHGHSQITQPVSFNRSTNPMKRSWAGAIFLAIIGFVIVSIVSLIAVLILCFIVSIFARGFLSTIGANILIFGIPPILAALVAWNAFVQYRPLKEDIGESKEQSNQPTEAIVARPSFDEPESSCEVASEPSLEHPCEVVNESPSEDKFQARKATAIAQFESELAALTIKELPVSTPVPRQLLKDLPPYSFSNVTRKTRLDSIFPLVVLDVETTDLRPSYGEIIEVSAIKFETGMIPVEAITTLCKAKKPIPVEATAVNRITDEMVQDYPYFAEVAPAVTEFLQGCHLAGHNLDFDLRFLHASGVKLPEGTRYYDTLDLAYLTVPNSSVWDYKLDTLCSHYKIWREGAHRALSDCYATAKLFASLVKDKTDRQLIADPDSETPSAEE